MASACTTIIEEADDPTIAEDVQPAVAGGDVSGDDGLSAEEIARRAAFRNDIVGLENVARLLEANPDDFISYTELQAAGSATYDGPFVLASSDPENGEGFFGTGVLKVEVGAPDSYFFTTRDMSYIDEGLNTVEGIEAFSSAKVTPDENGLLDIGGSNPDDFAATDTSITSSFVNGELYLPANVDQGRAADVALLPSGEFEAQFTNQQVVLRGNVTGAARDGSGDTFDFDGLFVGEK